MTEPASLPPDSTSPPHGSDDRAPNTHSQGTMNDPTIISNPAIPIAGSESGPAPSTSAPSSKPLVKTTIGQYELLELLGQGGMGAVYKARHINLDKLVALKLLKGDFMQSEDSVARFKREMKAVGKITHPNIVQAFDAGEINGTHYLAMELVIGTDLYHLVKQRGPFPVKDACKAIRQAALGLHAAHQEGLIHRDIKPANLLLAKNGQIKILDLGLALIANAGVAHEAITSSGQVLGTPDYMAPEQWENTHAIDLRTDLYALGCTLFCLLTGRAPFASDDYKSVVRKMAAHVNAPIPDLKVVRPDVPDGICAIYQRLMSKRPEDRYVSAAELAQALAPFSSSKMTESLVVSSPSAPPTPSHAGMVITVPNGGDTVQSIAATVTDVVERAPLAARRSRRKDLTTVAGAVGLFMMIGIGAWFMQNKTPISQQERLIPPGSLPRPNLPEAAKETPTAVAIAPVATREEISWHGWPADAPKAAVAPFDAAQAKVHQEEWAAYLKVPVEYENSIGMKFRLIPPGEFLMGSPQEAIEEAIKDAGGDAYIVEAIKREAPRHKVVLTQPFYLGTTEVTQQQYELVTGAKPGQSKIDVDTSKYPVDRISWINAIDFCCDLNVREGLKSTYSRSHDLVSSTKGSGYFLPTEAQWEYSCRAGETATYSSRPPIAEMIKSSWFSLNSGGSMHPVGLLQANPFGLFDMIGNLWEWCEDGQGDYSTYHSEVAVDPRFLPEVERLRILRGNDYRWGNNRSCLICSSPSFRHVTDFLSANDGVGIRIALSVDAVGLSNSGPGASRPAPSKLPPGTVDFHSQRKTAERLLRMDKGKISLVNKELASLGEMKNPLPNEAFCILSGSFVNADLTDDEAAVLSQATEIEDLNLTSNTHITSLGLRELTSLSKLRSVDLSYTAMNSETMSLVKSWPDLRRLNLAGTNVDDTGLEHLAACPHLEFLAVGKSKVTTDGLVKVVALCPFLKEVQIEVANADDGNRTLASLKNLRLLRSVRCSGNQLSTDGINSMRGLPQFEEIQLRSPTSDQAAQLLAGFGSKLHRIECLTTDDSDSGLSETGYQVLRNYHQLTHLRIGGKQGSPTDAVLADLAGLPVLKSFVVSFEESSRRYTPAGLALFRQLRPDVEFTADGKLYQALSNWPGKFDGSPRIEPWNLPKEAPPPAGAPFTSDEAARQQVAWAEYTKQPLGLTSNATGMKFRLIPAGESISSDGETSQLLRNRVPFYLGTLEVTVGEFRKFVDATGYVTDAEKFGVGLAPWTWKRERDRNWKSPGYEIRDDIPVTQVSSADANAFCAWLSKIDQGTYRLPTETEWIYSARAGAMGPYAWSGETAESQHNAGWFRGPINANQPVPTQRGGQKAANPFGLYDVIGNVWELCLDRLTCYRRGMAWGRDAYDSAWEARLREEVSADTGFRIVREIEGFPTSSLFDLGFAQHPILIERNAPLGPQVAVTRPTPIPGVRSWSVELADLHNQITSIAWSPNGDLFATACGGMSVQLWDRDGKVIRALMSYAGVVLSVSFSPDGTQLAAYVRLLDSSHLSLVQIWDVATGTCRAVVPIDDWGRCVAWSPDGKQIATGVPRFICFIDIATGKVRKAPVEGLVVSISWSSDSQTVCASLDDSKGPSLIEVANGQQIARLVVPVVNPQQGFAAVAWSPDGNWIAAQRQGQAFIWNAHTREIVRTIEVDFAAEGIAWNPESQLLAIYGWGLEIVNATTGKTIEVPRIRNHLMTAWSPDGAEFVLYTAAPQFFDARSGMLLRSSDEKGRNHAYQDLDRVFLTPDGRHLQLKRGWASERLDFDAETGQLLDRRKSPAGEALAHASNGDWTLYQKNDTDVVIVPKRFTQDPVTIENSGFSRVWRGDPSGKRIAEAFGQEVRIWESETGKPLGTLKHAAPVWSIEWSPDGSQMATISDLQAVRLWDTNTYEQTTEFKSLPQSLNAGSSGSGASVLAWSTDGQSLWIPFTHHIGLLELKTGRIAQMQPASYTGFFASLKRSTDGESLLIRESGGWTFVRDREGARHLLGQHLGISPHWCQDARRFVSDAEVTGVRGFDVTTRRRLGTLWPVITDNHWLCVGPTGHYRGSEDVESQIIYVAQLDDGSNITLSPAEFCKRFGWKNDPNKATLLKLDE